MRKRRSRPCFSDVTTNALKQNSTLNGRLLKLKMRNKCALGVFNSVWRKVGLFQTPPMGTFLKVTLCRGTNFLPKSQQQQQQIMTLYWDVVYRPKTYVSNEERGWGSPRKKWIVFSGNKILLTIVMTLIHVAGDIIHKLSIFKSPVQTLGKM